jgi:sucrose-6-phosphate hydrolase SacC (GH32 family)
MARTAKQKQRQWNEAIDVSVFQDIQIRFPGDAYILAVWMTMADMAKSTPTCQPHTTLLALARSFAMMYGTDYSNPLNSEDVMSVFRRHGISGNPILRLETTPEENLRPPIRKVTDVSRAMLLTALPRIKESGKEFL